LAVVDGWRAVEVEAEVEVDGLTGASEMDGSDRRREW